jgi:type III secretion protein N (ATPase)
VIARAVGHVVRTHGETVVAVLPGARVGAGVRIVRPHVVEPLDAVVTSVERGRVRLSPFGSVAGIAVGDRVETDACAIATSAGFALLGRAIDAAGVPLDGGAPIPRGMRDAPGLPDVGRRPPIARAFPTGIAAIDGLLAIGRGARIGIFGAPGAGKSTLLDAIVSGARSDAVVLALIGERGREAQRWIERIDDHTTIVCAVSDRSASERIRAADVAMTQANALCAGGAHVLLVVDSLARYVAALRERRTADGEPVGRGGYPASVWFDLARFLERAGNGSSGSITLIATVLSDGADEREPLADAARSLLDGHVVLSAALAQAGRFPAIDVLASASRTMASVVDATHARDAAAVRAALAYLAESRDARELGVGGPPTGRAAAFVAAEPSIEAFLRPPTAARAADAREALAHLAATLPTAADGVIEAA